MRNPNRKNGLMEKRARFGYFFVTPFIIGFLCFMAFPMIQSLVFSFQDITYNAQGYSSRFVGILHYRYLFVTDPAYRLQLLTSLRNMLLQVPLIIFFSFFAAVLLNQKFHGRLLARAIFFLPVILASSSILGMDVDSIMAVSSGGSGISDTASTATVSTAMQSLFLSMNLPSSFTGYIISGVNGISKIIAASGVQILLFLAALQTVTPSQLEAAHIEGANGWEIFWKITVPLVSPMILVSTLYTMIDSFTSNTNQVIKDIAEQYSDLQLGLGSAMAWLYLSVIFLVIALIYWLLSKAVFYQGDR